MADPVTSSPGSRKPEAPDTRYKRRLRNYLLNLRLQLRYTMTMVAISGVLTGGLGYVIMSKTHEASRLVEVRAMDPTDPLGQELAAQFAQNDKIMLLILVAFGLVMSLFLTGYGIVLTHKIAGPLFKVAKHLDEMRDGRLGVVYNLRKGDELVEFFEHFKNAHDALRARTAEDVVLLDKAIAAVGASPVAGELEAAKRRKEDSLK